MPQERVESVVGGAFETRWEHAFQEGVIVRVNHHLVLVLPQLQMEVGKVMLEFLLN